MKTVFDKLITKIESFQKEKDDIIAGVITKNAEWLVNKNREQLLSGQNNEGDLLMPYKQDPFFKSPQQAQWYANWKKKKGFNTTPKPEGTPDLFINGYFHRSIQLIRRGNTFKFFTDAESEMRSDIKDKYPKALGVQEKHKQKFYLDFILPKLKQKIGK